MKSLEPFLLIFVICISLVVGFKYINTAIIEIICLAFIIFYYVEYNNISKKIETPFNNNINNHMYSTPNYIFTQRITPSNRPAMQPSQQQKPQQPQQTQQKPQQQQQHPQKPNQQKPQTQQQQQYTDIGASAVFINNPDELYDYMNIDMHNPIDIDKYKVISNEISLKDVDMLGGLGDTNLCNFSKISAQKNKISMDNFAKQNKYTNIDCFTEELEEQSNRAWWDDDDLDYEF